MGVLSLLAASSSSSSSAAGAGVVTLFMFLIYAVVIVAWIAGMWKVFEKAGQKGWFALIPILNTYVLIRIAGREAWWIILFFIPCVSFVVMIIVCMDVAPKFGKSQGYGIGLALLGPIFFPMLGFGDAQYQGDTTPIF